MIAVVNTFDMSIKLINNTNENRELLEAAGTEYAVKANSSPACDKLDELLKTSTAHSRGQIIPCSAVFVYQSEW